jgi:EpsI family protein
MHDMAEANRRRMLVVLLGSLGAAFASHAVRPTRRLTDELGELNLERLVPKAFGDWTLEPQLVSSIVNPQTQELIDKLYAQVLTRTYVHRDGYRIMLSIAYGGDQRDALQVHFPEVCYAAQGFAIGEQRTEKLDLGGNSLAVRRISTSMGKRRPEPLTYWVMVGEKPVNPGLSPTKKVAEMSYTLRGVIPDGLLTRISSIDENAEHAYTRQTEFARAMMASIKGPERRRLVGV